MYTYTYICTHINMHHTNKGDIHKCVPIQCHIHAHTSIKMPDRTLTKFKTK